MLPWIKRWHDWAMTDLWPLNRLIAQPQALHWAYEKAGLTISDQPIPWCAEAVLVEANLRLTTLTSRRKSDFQLRLPTQETVPCENLRALDDNPNLYRVHFRLPRTSETTTAELLWRGHSRGQVTLPVLSREHFLQNLRLQMPTLFVRLGEESVACQTFVCSQCRGLQAGGLLASATSLVPLLDLDLQVEFRCQRTGVAMRIPARLSSSQLAGRQAMVSVAPRKFPRRIGSWTVTWLLNEQPLASHQVKVISQRTFQRSLRVSDTRFVVQTAKGGIQVARQAPPLDTGDRVGPCFLVCSREAGMAGLCPVQVHAQVSGSVRPPLLLEQEVLITDGPTMVAPGTLDAADLAQVSGFEVSVKGQSLGVLPLCPAPAATFTSEGGFKLPPEFSWSSAADQELNERLSRLLESGGTP
jgi:hypothetical protein